MSGHRNTCTEIVCLCKSAQCWPSASVYLVGRPKYQFHQRLRHFKSQSSMRATATLMFRLSGVRSSHWCLVDSQTGVSVGMNAQLWWDITPFYCPHFNGFVAPGETLFYFTLDFIRKRASTLCLFFSPFYLFFSHVLRSNCNFPYPNLYIPQLPFPQIYPLISPRKRAGILGMLIKYSITNYNETSHMFSHQG